MDVMAVREAGRLARARAASGEGPTILEMDTYRYRGHSMSDPAKYRSREEVESVKTTRDPIDNLRVLLEQAKICDEAELKAVDVSVRKIVLEAAEFASTTPEPDPGELMKDIYLAG
jgi:pyruvate dehydrogenase E1 component alpha subunit